MPRDHLLRVLAALSISIAALHITATVFYLYWTFWWYDMFLHLLGGVFAALLLLWFLFFSGYVHARAELTVFRVFAVALLSAVLLGAWWEIFERLVGHTWSIEGYWPDTAIDVMLDVVGGVVGWLYFVKKYRV